MNRHRFAVVTVAALAVVGVPISVSAQDSWTHHLDTNDLTLSVGAGFNFGTLSFAIYPGAEWTVAAPKFGVVPVSFGAAARGRIGISGGITVGAAALAVAHLGLNGLPIPEVFQAIEGTSA